MVSQSQDRGDRQPVRGAETAVRAGFSIAPVLLRAAACYQRRKAPDGTGVIGGPEHTDAGYGALNTGGLAGRPSLILLYCIVLYFQSK